MNGELLVAPQIPKQWKILHLKKIRTLCSRLLLNKLQKKPEDEKAAEKTKKAWLKRNQVIEKAAIA